jgi:hypothetical protein
MRSYFYCQNKPPWLTSISVTPKPRGLFFSVRVRRQQGDQKRTGHSEQNSLGELGLTFANPIPIPIPASTAKPGSRLRRRLCHLTTFPFSRTAIPPLPPPLTSLPPYITSAGIHLVFVLGSFHLLHLQVSLKPHLHHSSLALHLLQRDHQTQPPHQTGYVVQYLVNHGHSFIKLRRNTVSAVVPLHVNAKSVHLTSAFPQACPTSSSKLHFQIRSTDR